MGISPLSSRTTSALSAEARRVSEVQDVNSGGQSGSGTAQERDPASAVIRDLLSLRSRVAGSKPMGQSPYGQKAFEPQSDTAKEEDRLRLRLAARLIEVEREVQRVAENHRELLEKEVPSEARALEMSSPETYLELAARPVVPTAQEDSEDPALLGQGEPAVERRYELHYDRVTESLDRVVEALVSSRRDLPPGSLLDVEA